MGAWNEVHFGLNGKSTSHDKPLAQDVILLGWGTRELAGLLKTGSKPWHVRWYAEYQAVADVFCLIFTALKEPVLE